MAYIGKTPTVGNFQKCDSLSASATADYTLQVGSSNVSPESVNHMIVSLNGVIQAPTTAYTVSGSTLSFASALTSNDTIDFVILLGNVLDIGTPSDDTVATVKIQDDAVSLAKMASGTDGNIISYDTSGNPVAVATGTDGQVLTSSGAGAVCAFEDGGAFVKVASTNITSDVTVITFQEVFDSTYDRYIIYGDGVFCDATASNLRFRVLTGTATVQSGAGDYTMSGTASRIVSGNTSSAITSWGNWDTYGECSLTFNDGIGDGTGVRKGSTFTIEISNPSGTTNSTFMSAQIAYEDDGGGIHSSYGHYVYTETTAMTGINFHNSTFSRGRISIYGVKY